jgi:endonuclease/exonuclease/phosphatase (EEP) superfamily protein YafD
MPWILLLALLFTGGSLFGERFWFFEACSHFRVQAMQLSLPFIAYTIWKRKNRQALVWICIALIHYYPVFRLYNGTPFPASTPTYRAMLLHQHESTVDDAQLQREIHRFDPDFILLLEATSAIQSLCESLRPTYEHQIHAFRDDPYGIALLSRLAMNPSHLPSSGDNQLPSIQTDLHTPCGSFTFIGTPPPPPLNRALAHARDPYFHALSKWTHAARYPVVLMGDLNATPFAHSFHQLIEESGLHDSTLGFGFQPTWYVGNPLLQLPFDHFLHDEKIIIHQRIIGNDLGSDHRPLLVEFSLDHPR